MLKHGKEASGSELIREILGERELDHVVHEISFWSLERFLFSQATHIRQTDTKRTSSRGGLYLDVGMTRVEELEKKEEGVRRDPIGMVRDAPKYPNTQELGVLAQDVRDPLSQVLRGNGSQMERKPTSTLEDFGEHTVMRDSMKERSWT